MKLTCVVDIWIKCDKNVHCSLVYVKKFSLDCYSPSFHFENPFMLQEVLWLLKELLCMWVLSANISHIRIFSFIFKAESKFYPFYKKFYTNNLSLWSIFELIFVKSTRYGSKLLFLVHGNPNFPVYSVEKSILSSLNYVCPLVENSSFIYEWVYFWTFFSVPMIYMPIFH